MTKSEQNLPKKESGARFSFRKVLGTFFGRGATLTPQTDSELRENVRPIITEMERESVTMVDHGNFFTPNQGNDGIFDEGEYVRFATGTGKNDQYAQIAKDTNQVLVFQHSNSRVGENLIHQSMYEKVIKKSVEERANQLGELLVKAAELTEAERVKRLGMLSSLTGIRIDFLKQELNLVDPTNDQQLLNGSVMFGVKEKVLNIGEYTVRGEHINVFVSQDLRVTAFIVSTSSQQFAIFEINEAGLVEQISDFANEDPVVRPWLRAKV